MNNCVGYNQKGSRHTKHLVCHVKLDEQMVETAVGSPREHIVNKLLEQIQRILPSRKLGHSSIVPFARVNL